jgi:hypothetical protein
MSENARESMKSWNIDDSLDLVSSTIKEVINQ